MSQLLDRSAKPLAESFRSWSQRKPLQRFARWVDWRITKKVALWSGRYIKRQVPMFWGQGMTIVYPEYVSGMLGRHGFFEYDVTTALMDVLEPGMVFLDVGSHFGFYSLLASTAVGPTGQVHAFEPVPDTFAVLKENADRRPNIQCHNLAVYSEPKTLDFWVQDLWNSSVNFVVNDACQLDDPHVRPGRLRRVEAIKLDDFANQHGDVDVVKLDVEGVEGPVLRGMSQLLARRKPIISMEVGDRVNKKTHNERCRDNVQFLLDFGYQAFDYRTGQAVPHTIQDTYQTSNLLFRHPDW